jgi:DNA-directed RNA polymerase specialized sigma24 family protein
LSCSFDESEFHGRFDWLETIENPELVEKLSRLSDADKELLTLLAFYGYSQKEIAAMQGCSNVVVCKKIKRLKKYFQSMANF